MASYVPSSFNNLSPKSLLKSQSDPDHSSIPGMEKNARASSMITVGFDEKASPTHSYNRGKDKDLVSLVYLANFPTAGKTYPFGKEKQSQILPSEFKSFTPRWMKQREAASSTETSSTT